MEHIFQSLSQFWEYTGFANCAWQNVAMIVIGLVFITLAIVKACTRVCGRAGIRR